MMNETEFAKVGDNWIPIYELVNESGKTREEIKKLYYWTSIDFT